MCKTNTKNRNMLMNSHTAGKKSFALIRDKLYNQEIIIEKVTLDTENSITTIKGLEIFGVDLNAASTKRSALGLLWSRALLKRRRLMFERLYPVPLLGTSLQQPGHKFLSLQYSS